MLILSALGVSEEVIMKDYLLTNTFNADSINAQRKMLLSNGIKESELDRYMIVLDEVNPVLMKTVMSWLKENYGSPVGYIINELGITEEEIETLKAKFLEE
jgi:protein-tyrosine phosphatase